MAGSGRQSAKNIVDSCFVNALDLRKSPAGSQFREC